jgi:sugar O-acyltransferase (sialic acid O-acetyltransferase NeuD family)
MTLHPKTLIPMPLSMETTKLKQIAIFGAGGFGKEIACVINKINEVKNTWKLIGFFDDGIQHDTNVSHFGKILGNTEDLNNWKEEISIVFAIGSPRIIEKIVNSINNEFVLFPNLIHPDVFFADNTSFKIGKGNVIVRGCTFSVDVEVGDFNQFNSLSALSHDVCVGSFNVFMPLTRVSGEVKIGDFNAFGIGTIILQCIKIGNRVRVAPSSVVYTKTKDNCLYMGNPAKRTIL